jgi:hypothetical protein
MAQWRLRVFVSPTKKARAEFPIGKTIAPLSGATFPAQPDQ